jgi:hypothetical protein
MALINWNKYNFDVGDIVWLDEKYNNKIQVEIIWFTTNKLFCRVQVKENEPWDVMTNRLTPIK